ncbi:MAG: hypothetical protein ACI9SY_000573, partial [Candidatus Paceibacteria bacterium]
RNDGRFLFKELLQLLLTGAVHLVAIFFASSKLANKALRSDI